MSRLSQTAVVLCPMPFVDEIDREVLGDTRIRIYEQSDAGVRVRMAVLDWLT